MYVSSVKLQKKYTEMFLLHGLFMPLFACNIFMTKDVNYYRDKQYLFLSVYQPIYLSTTLLSIVSSYISIYLLIYYLTNTDKYNTKAWKISTKSSLEIKR